MATSIATPSESALPAERFFRTSLSLLILTSTVTLVSTGKLDVITSFAAPLIVLYKGFGSWHGRPPNFRRASHLVRARLPGVLPRGRPVSLAFLCWKFIQSAAIRRPSGSGAFSDFRHHRPLL